jgi:hypothetical protein
MFVPYNPGAKVDPWPPIHLPTSVPIHLRSILPSPSSQISTLYYKKDIMFNHQIIMALKLKITIHYINDITSPVILILPSLASSPRIRSKSASLTPMHHY